jgi:extradiol dioxygenase family protein
MKHPFHLAFPVSDLETARSFYLGVLGCTEGRSSDTWVDFNFYGHQIVAHLSNAAKQTIHNPVDGKQVPVPHFGVILEWEEWHRLAEHLRSRNVTFVIEPYIRFKGQVGEQATMFVLDPDGNALEFKAFKDRSLIFAR